MGEKKIRIKLKSFDHRLLDRSVKEIIEIAKSTGVSINGPVPLPTKREVYTVLRSPHVNKKSREQFQLKIHKRLIDIIDPTPRTVDALSKLNLPAGVEVEMKLS
ncbi:MAG: 30S ribosomal protein S10 [Candidatus Omnitrophica bacterium]|nr:30S ribosomal protein S10 [Candidatus Omnitrophota bacterium]MCM8830159.1 30S ribosomal protein S10 [Candidatus Omnitrophota bacterium]